MDVKWFVFTARFSLWNSFCVESQVCSKCQGRLAVAQWAGQQPCSTPRLFYTLTHTHTPTVCTSVEPQHPWRVQAEMIPKSGCILQTWAVPPQSENLLSWRAGDAVDLRSVKSKKENSNFGWASGSPQKPVLVLISLCPHFSICEMVTHTQTPPLKPNAASDQKFSSKCGAKQNKIKYAIIKMKTTAGKPALHFPEVLSTSSPFSSFYLYLSACTDRHIAN